MRSSLSPDFECTRILNGRISDPHWIPNSRFLCSFIYNHWYVPVTRELGTLKAAYYTLTLILLFFKLQMDFSTTVWPKCSKIQSSQNLTQNLKKMYESILPKRRTEKLIFSKVSNQPRAWCSRIRKIFTGNLPGNNPGMMFTRFCSIFASDKA